MLKHSLHQRSVCSGRGRAPRSVTAAFTFQFPFMRQKTQDQAPKREAAKQQLLDLVRPLKRGLTASPEDEQRVEEAASALEALNPTSKPLASPLLNGQWRLVYTTSASILGKNKPAPFRPSGEIFQILDNATLTAKNQETFPFYNSVTAALTPVSDNKVAVQFKQFKVLNLLSVTAPDSARGELAITYLDDELRVSRGDKGNLFVLEMDDRNVRP